MQSQEITTEEYQKRQLESLGGKRIRISFNPSKIKAVDDIKHKTAELINIVHNSQTNQTSSEGHRLNALAKTSYEEACMWAVKALTINK